MSTVRQARWTGIALAAAALVALVVAVVLAGGGGSGDRAADGTGSAPATTTVPPSTVPPSAVPPEPSTSPAPSTSTVPGPPATVPPASPSPPAAAVPAALRGQDVSTVPTDRRVVALTFDAGAGSSGLASILRTLADERVPATFFLTGRWAAADPAGVEAIRAAGHRIGNHSATHPHLTGLSTAAIAAEVRGAEATLRAAGVDPRPLFRFPFGDRDARTVTAVNDLGYVAVRWTVDTLGWQGTSGGRTATSVVDRVMGALQPGEIVLMHVGAHPEDGSTLDADALPALVDRIRAAGYGFVTLDALFPG
ncbi:polysaccharide deacetylase family protein [Blastococcus sp. MG754426]|uniref:polysaccharide deacetylase family protein n=1 Tax=unclassified Blastococcus TaxID=2619396 RepID=UPI001EF0B930|nr:MULTISPECIES: polysaccharide deacetylase family protein [unclassified Blastococcus]MCF6507284.1 polysaccharide deacetylase family protein [Blastococcus sp. MG754426]MCF6510770.1 polysaccharide deacetylase family protein [Blastococcus sp. MG754427]